MNDVMDAVEKDAEEGGPFETEARTVAENGRTIILKLTVELEVPRSFLDTSASGIEYIGDMMRETAEGVFGKIKRFNIE